MWSKKCISFNSLDFLVGIRYILLSPKPIHPSHQKQPSFIEIRAFMFYFFSTDPKVMIIDEYGAPLQEKYYEMNSTLQLSCIVRNVVMSTSVVYWSHGDEILNYDITRGGIRWVCYVLFSSIRFVMLFYVMLCRRVFSYVVWNVLDSWNCKFHGS